MGNPLQQNVQQIGLGLIAAGSSAVTVVNPPGGTVNTIPKFTTATALGDSAITDDGSQVAIANRSVLASINDANNAAVINVLSILHTTSGAAANGIGVSQTFLAEDSAGQSENIAMIAALLTNVTSGAEASRLDFYTRIGGAAPTVAFSMWGSGGSVVGPQVTQSDPGVGVLGFANSATKGVAFRRNDDSAWIDVLTMSGASDILFLGNAASSRLQFDRNVGTFDLFASSTAKQHSGGHYFTDYANTVAWLTITSTGIVQALAETTTVSDVATVTTTDALTLIHATSGVPGVAFGVGLLFQLEDSTSTNVDDAARIAVKWLDATSTSEDSQIVFERRVAGAALAQGMALGQGLVVGAAGADPTAGNLLLAGGQLYLGASTSGVILHSAGVLFLQALVSSATTQIVADINATAAGTHDRFRINSGYGAVATAGTLFGIVVNGATRKFAVGWGGDVQLEFTATLTANPTINSASGRARLAAGATTCVVTNDRVSADSRVDVIFETVNDATALYMRGVTKAAGSFTVTVGPAASTGTMDFVWKVTNTA